VAKIEGELELEEALLDLGYDKSTVRKTIKKISPNLPFNERLKEALKLLGSPN